jgi:uroporphyrinogen-III synthase
MRSKPNFELPLIAEHPDQLANTLFLCISRNVATAVPARYKRSLVVSATPDEDGLLDLL